MRLKWSDLPSSGSGYSKKGKYVIYDRKVAYCIT